MPYIKSDKRPQLDNVVKLMIVSDINTPGNLNYVLFRLARYIPPSYTNYRNFLGELHEAAEEIRRRMLVPYEEEKIEENGDVL